MHSSYLCISSAYMFTEHYSFQTIMQTHHHPYMENMMKWL